MDPVYPTNYADTIKSEVELATGSTVTIEKLYFMSGHMDGLDYFGQQEANLEALERGLGAE